MANAEKVIIVDGPANASRVVQVVSPTNATVAAGIDAGNARKVVLAGGSDNAERMYFVSGGGSADDGKLVVFGDSITSGVAATAAVYRWANIVATATGWTLNNQGISGTVLQNSNLSGGSPGVNNGYDRYQTALLGGNLSSHYVILYGLNDLRYTAAVDVNVDNFQTQLSVIVEGLIAAAVVPSRIVLCSPTYVTPFGYTQGSAGFTGSNDATHVTYNTAVHTIASQYGCTFADVYTATKNMPASYIDTDGIHPLNAGHAVIASTVLNAINQPHVFVNAEAAAAVARMTTAPSNTHKALIDAFVSNRKVGLTNATDSYTGRDVIVLPSKAGVGNQWINIVQNAFNPVVSTGAPIFAAATGDYTTDGVDDVLGYGFNPSTAGGSFARDSHNYAVYSRNTAVRGSTPSGAFNGTDGIGLNTRVVTTNRFTFRAMQATLSQTANDAITDGSGLGVINRSGASATQARLRGSIPTISTAANQASTALVNAEMKFGVFNNVFVADSIAGYELGSSLSSNAMADQNAAWVAFVNGFTGL